VSNDVLVIGGGIAGIQAALDLAEMGIQVHMVERLPSIGGKMAQLDKTFPTNDCAMCIISPKLVEAGRHPNIEILATSDLLRLDGRPAAAVYGLRYGPTFSFYQSGFDPALARHSVGLVALGLSIREAIAEGATEYDLLHGREPYKFLWARRTRDLGRIDLFPPTLGGRWRWHAASLRGGVARRTARVRAALEAARP